MKRTLLSAFLLATLGVGSVWAQGFVNLTPRPRTMTVNDGALTLPSQFTISYSDLDEASVKEVQLFADNYTKVTGATVNVAADDANALFQLSLIPNTTLKNGGYMLNVTANKVEIKAKNALGFFYALQSVKKMLPANVMAGVKDETITTFTLPLVNITDEPRFAYRGFMLDVSRHFFTVEEVKRMIDVMSYYKLNAFHWHLSDDQGWRVEIKKYPKLTSVASIRSNSMQTDMYERTQYWTNQQYGPYYYTQDEIMDVVAYAKERHIDVIPEIDMPGHFCAALTAYPEFSCTPKGTHVVQTTGGIFNDVMNVANPDAVQFTKDILTELMELFPSEYIHIGGDECPTTAWENNAECKALYQKLGLSSYRQLQSHFIQEMAEHVQANGRKLSVWNEAITANGADLDIMKGTKATVYCWTKPVAAAKEANKLGLPNIYTPWGPYYINRKQGTSALNPPGAGSGTDHVKATYNETVPSETDYGVQGTFWTENVSDADYMEWLSLPRLLAIAESGWTPAARKSFTDFQQRMTADTVLLNYGKYKYCKYYMVGEAEDAGSSSDKVMPFANTTDKKYYYRIISGGTDDTRKGRCIEVLPASSSLITTYSNKGAAEGVLWTNAQASSTDDNYDYQWWSIEEDPNNAGKYALVCKAMPEGSVKANPSATSTAGRWSYDKSAKHYNFELGTGAYGKKGNNYYYTIASDQVSGQYFNSSMIGQGLAVNVYSAPNDGAGGQWEFSPLENYGTPGTEVVTFDYLQEGKTYTFTNAVEGFGETAIVDNANSTQLKHSTDAAAHNAWKVEGSVINADGSQTVKLKNVATGRYISSVGEYSNCLGFPVSVANTSNFTVTLSYVPAYDDLRVKADGKSMFALPSGNVYAGSTISKASYDASRNQGAEWKANEVNVVTFVCTDSEGNPIGSFVRSIPVSITNITTANCPAIKNFSVESCTAGTETNTYNVVYKRSQYTVTYNVTDAKGAIVSRNEVNVPVGETYKVELPTIKYYTQQSADEENGATLTLTDDRTINAVYTTDAITGVKADGDVVTTVEAGKSYLFYDATTVAGRAGYRTIVDGNGINRTLTAEALTPAGIWTLEGSGSTFKVKNEYLSLYVPQLQSSTAATASTTGGTFTFALNADGETWNIKGSNGQYWDGVENGNLVGWGSGTGHPIRISTFFAQPLYPVTVLCVDADNKTLSKTTELIKAGDAYTIVIPTIKGYNVTKVTGNESYAGTVEGYVDVEVTYTPASADGINEVSINGKAGCHGIYDLQGRRLNGIGQRGVYIINGQKTLVK